MGEQLFWCFTSEKNDRFTNMFRKAQKNKATGFMKTLYITNQ